MGHTLRNVFFLLIFCLLAFKGVEHLAKVAKNDSGNRVQRVVESAPTPDQTNPDDDEAMVLEAGANGHFTVAAWVDGTDIDFIVDTGASTVVLSPDDANRLGLHQSSLDYDVVFSTANGEIRAAMVTLSDLRIGPIELDDVKAAVIQSPMAMSLLGMTALDRLGGYEVEGDHMILRW